MNWAMQGTREVWTQCLQSRLIERLGYPYHIQCQRLNTLEWSKGGLSRVSGTSKKGYLRPIGTLKEATTDGEDIGI